MSEPLDKFGAFITRNLYDKIVEDVDMLLDGAWKAPDLQPLQKKIAQFSPAQKEVLREVAVRLATTGAHDLLFAIQEEEDGSIQVVVDGKNVAKLSDGLHGEIFTEDGWIAKFSEVPKKEG